MRKVKLACVLWTVPLHSISKLAVFQCIVEALAHGDVGRTLRALEKLLQLLIARVLSILLLLLWLILLWLLLLLLLWLVGRTARESASQSCAHGVTNCATDGDTTSCGGHLCKETRLSGLLLLCLHGRHRLLRWRWHIAAGRRA